MAVVLTEEQLEFMARAASWKFDVDFRDCHGDPVVYTGDGVDDLDQLIIHVTGSLVAQPVIRCDTGKLFSNYVIVTVDDIYALRTKYIEINGTVNKPTYPWQETKGNAVEIR